MDLSQFKTDASDVPPDLLETYASEIRRRVMPFEHPSLHPDAVDVLAHNLACIVHVMRSTPNVIEDRRKLFIHSIVEPLMRSLIAHAWPTMDMTGEESVETVISRVVGVFDDMTGPDWRP